VDAFTPDMLIRDVLTAHPEVTSVFERHGLGCPGCLAADMETLSAVASMHDIRLDDLLDDLNALARVDGEGR
jgi:hybrid cluster-associated redox disulfide protein